MNRVLVVAEHAEGNLSPATARCVACASQLPSAEVTVLVLASDAAQPAAQAAAIAGVARVLTVEHAANGQPIAAVLAPQVAEVARTYTHVFGPSTTFGKDLMPRVAALLDAPQISELMAVVSARVFKRPIYAGNAIVTVEIPEGLLIVATVRVASFLPAEKRGLAAIESTTVLVELPSHTRYSGLVAAKSDRPDLQTAARVVSGGRALGSAENFKLVVRLAEKLNAAVGASRAAVDAGFTSNELQVGQTGKIIAPDLYIALGISGAIQHLAGVKDARTIVAINKDPDAPIFDIADFGLVADLFQAIPEFEKLIS